MYYFIVNPASGSSRGHTVWNTVRTELDRNHISYKAFLLSHRGEARVLAASLAQRKQPFTLVVVGGDGTINETVDGLFSASAEANPAADSHFDQTRQPKPDTDCSPDLSHITFGCIPTGSGNDFVRGLGLPKDPVDALKVVLHPATIRKINIGCTTLGSAKRSFAVSSGIGFDAAVCNCVLDSGLKTALNHFHSGKLVYLFTALWQILSMKRRTLRVAADDHATETFEKAYFAAAMNLRYEGGGFQFCPDAEPDDDFLDLLVVNKISRLRALTVLPLAFPGKHVGKDGVHIVRCKKAKITADAPLCIHTDGEIPAFSEQVTFSLHERKLAVIVH